MKGYKATIAKGTLIKQQWFKSEWESISWLNLQVLEITGTLQVFQCKRETVPQWLIDQGYFK